MKEKIKHELVVLLVMAVIASGISVFLNNVSFNPDFSVLDAVSGATKKTHRSHSSQKESTVWNYTAEDVVLQNQEEFKEERITTGTGTYRILRRIEDEQKRVVLLDNKENSSYQKAAQDVALYLKANGYDVQIKECTETMMLSLVHAGRFDIFLMSKEETE